MAACIVCAWFTIYNDGTTCDRLVLPSLLTTFCLVLSSLIITVITLYQIHKFYISKLVSLSSLGLDLLILGCGIWVCYDIKLLDSSCPNISWLGKAGASLLAAFIFIRVYNIVLVFLFIFFILPMYLMPDCCICKRWLTNIETFDKTIWQLLEQGEWVYQERAMGHTSQRAKCFLCLDLLQQDNVVMAIPCRVFMQSRMTETKSNITVSSFSGMREQLPSFGDTTH